jgi:general stress protein YciG
MGGSRHPGRLKILEILKRNASNFPSKVRQTISIILHLQGILQVPKSDSTTLLQSQSTYQASPTFNQTRYPDFQLLRHQVFHKHSTASLASNHFHETSLSGLRRDPKEKQFSSDKQFTEDIGARRGGTSPTARRTLESCSAQSNFIIARRTEHERSRAR